MALSPGTTIGPYLVERELGRGGMGEVFLARDSRLDRLVAIKALPEHLACDPERMSRFEREAKILASLNHAHVGAIYGLEDAGAGRHYLILEFVEGKSLAEVLHGPMPVAEALSIAKQIAEALEAAHEKGIVHRDLKPGNVMVTPEGVVKVLDFGIARMPEHVVPESPASPQAPTVKSPARAASPTIPGALMGSPGYMSPEQALGKDTDKRSDIFAFGCVLYEMLTGMQAFPGENTTASLAAVLHLEPEWSRLPGDTPLRIRELLLNLLTKERRQRLHDIGDARLAIELAIQHREWVIAVGASPIATRGGLSRAIPWVIAAVLLTAAAVVALRSPSGAGPAITRSVAPIRLRIDSPDAPPTSVYSTCSVAVTADGKQVAYVGYTSDREGFVAVRRLDEASGHRVRFSDVDPHVLPIPLDIMFSPDGKRIAGFQQSGLFMNAVQGGEPTLLHLGKQFVASKGGTWTNDGIVFSPAPNAGLLLVSERGGEPRTITVPDASRQEISHRYPDVLPDGRRVLMTIKKAGILTFDDAEIALLDLDSGKWKTILTGGSFARYIPTGHLIFARNGSIMAVPFDAERGEVKGTPVAVISGVMTAPGAGSAGFAVSRESGTLVYMPGGPDETRAEMIWIGLDGKIEPVGAPVMSYSSVALSPDGTRIAAGVWGANDAVFVHDLNRRSNTRITFRGNCGGPQWSADGRQIVYSSDLNGPLNFFTVAADGSGEPINVSSNAVQENTCYATIDGKPGMVFDLRGDIWFQPLSADPALKLVGSQFEETSPRVSPDGKWLSYSSNETGQQEVYIRPFPLSASSGSVRWQVSVGGGRFSNWMPGSDALVYIRHSDSVVFRVTVEPGSTPRVGSPERLFALQMPQLSLQPTPDGKRFLALRSLPAKYKVSQVQVVLNWFDELKAKAPTGSK